MPRSKLDGPRGAFGGEFGGALGGSGDGGGSVVASALDAGGGR
jgi:hypothetical protein